MWCWLAGGEMIGEGMQSAMSTTSTATAVSLVSIAGTTGMPTPSDGLAALAALPGAVVGQVRSLLAATALAPWTSPPPSDPCPDLAP